MAYYLPKRIKLLEVCGRSLILVFCSLLFWACSEPRSSQHNANQQSTPEPTTSIKAEETIALSQALWNLSFEPLAATAQHSRSLEQAIVTLLNQPKQETLMAAREQWRLTFHHFRQLLPFLYMANQQDVIFATGAWPLLPGYLDSYGIYSISGIVNDISVPLDPHSLRKQHGLMDSEELALGIHPIEFILWATDNDEAVLQRLRPAETAPDGYQLEELANNRRRQLLALQAQLLAEELTGLEALWSTLVELESRPNPLRSFHAAIKQCLQDLERLMTIHGKGGPENQLNMNHFAGKREDSLVAQITMIQKLYFGTNNHFQLAQVELNSKEADALKLALDQVKTELSKKGHDQG